MDATQLAYWIQGMLEYTNVSELSEADLKLKLQGIKDHTALVFNKVTPQVPVVRRSLNDLDKEISDGIKKSERKEISPTAEESRIQERRFRDIVDSIKNPRPEIPFKFPKIDPSTWPKVPGYEVPYMPPFQSPYFMIQDTGYGKGPIC